MIACGGSPPVQAPAGAPPPAATAAAMPAVDPLRMPESLVDHMTTHGWGQMHLEWHTVRRWDRLPPSAVAYAERQGWKRAAHQEGEPGNGLEFLAMHHVMIEMLVEHDPAARPYVAGWTTPPVDPHDAAEPLPAGAATPFSPDMLAALDRLEHHLETFHSEDELGRYIETSFAPTAGDPEARSADRTAGVHNYLHNRFGDRTSPIDLGNPTLNLFNQRFWRLHGWIDQVWMRYRAQAHLSDQDPAYRAALQAATSAMAMKKGMGTREPAPAELLDAVRP